MRKIESRPVNGYPFDRIDDKIGRMLDRSMAALTEAMALMKKKERLHQIRFENMTAQILLWKYRAAAHKAHHTMKKRKLTAAAIIELRGKYGHIAKK